MMPQKTNTDSYKKRIPQGPARPLDKQTADKLIKEHIQKYDKVLRRLANK